MKFEKELCETINKLPNAKARITYLGNLLKKENNSKKRDIIKKLLSNSEKELEANTKKVVEKRRTPALEDIVKPSIMPLSSGSLPAVDEDYVRPAASAAPAIISTAATKPAAAGNDEYVKKEDYKIAGVDKSYIPAAKSEYLGKLEGEMAFRAREESTAFNPTKPLEDYIPEKESEEYKRMEQFKQISAEVKKNEGELEEYMRKKRAGLI